MFKHRSNLDIIACILEQALNGATQTRIQYQCNLSYDQVKFYIAFLLKEGYLTHGSEYHTADRGHRFIEAYKNLAKVSGSLLAEGQNKKG